MTRNRTQPRKIGTVDGKRMREAVGSVLNEGRSLHSACNHFDIAFGTLWNYVEKAKKCGNLDSMEFAPHYDVRRVFSTEEEAQLKEYFMQASKAHYGLSTKAGRSLAYDFAKRKDLKIPSSWRKNGCAGEDWFSSFLKRSPELSLRRPEGTSMARATGFNKESVTLFYDNLEEVMKKHAFEPSDIYNADETGFMTVQNVSKGRIIACRNEKQVGLITSAERGSLVTAMCCVNAIGNSIPPFMIFPRVHFKDHMILGAPPGTVGVAHSSGWMTAENFTKFIQHFIKSTKCSQEHKVLLILDNHESHVSVESLKLAKENGVVVLTFPPHCSHKLQPLDRTVYGPMKSYYNSAANSHMISRPGSRLTIYNVAELVGKAFPLAATPRNITSGFKCTGIYPLDRHIFADEDFSACRNAKVASPPGHNPCGHPPHDSPTNTAPCTDTPASCQQTPADVCQPKTPDTSPCRPEHVRPLPGCLQEGPSRARQGSSKVLTSTPVINRLQECKSLRELAKQKQATQNRKRVIGQSERKQRRKRAKLIRREDANDTSSESETDRATEKCLEEELRRDTDEDECSGEDTEDAGTGLTIIDPEVVMGAEVVGAEGSGVYCW